MRKFIYTFLFIILYAVPSYSQNNITNTLGTSGTFSIKDASNNYFFTLAQATGLVNILKNLRLEHTTGSDVGVICKGSERFLHNYGIGNTFLGLNSGNFSMTGIGGNTAVGISTLIANTTGGYNVAIGCASLSSNTSGYQNVAVGWATLNKNETGIQNTAMGQSSMEKNTTGNSNTAIGWATLAKNLTGCNNTALGMGSLLNCTVSENTAVGYQSLYTNSTGTWNTALGFQSLYTNSTGNDNTSVGYQSLYKNTTGIRNTALGLYALYCNTTGSNNTALGRESLFYNSSGLYNIAIGSVSMFRNQTGSNNTTLGYNSLHQSLGGENTALGSSAGYALTSGNNVTVIGYNSQPSSNSVSNEITLGDGRVSSLRCNTTTITALSDARDKKNINDLNLGINFIMKLKPRIYNWDRRDWYDDNKSDGSKMQETPTAGFIAQELDEVQTSENAEWLNLVLKNNPDKLEATPGNLLPVVVKAVQDLKTENDDLKTEVSDLKSRLTALEQKSGIQNQQSAGFISGNININFLLLLIFSTAGFTFLVIKKLTRK